MSFARRNRGDLIATLAALVAGIVSAAVLPSLTYDSWAWMVWARELAHLSLAADGGPVIKPLPILVAAPLAPFGDAAPFVWLSLARASFLLCGWLAWRIGLVMGDRLAGALAAAAVLLVPGLFLTALQGYSEPVFVLLVLVAILALLSDRATPALVALSLAGLLRSEEWAFLLVAAAWATGTGRVRWDRALFLAIAPALVWFGMDWAGSGDPMRSLAHAAGGQGRTVGEQLDHMVEDLGLINLLGSTVALLFAVSRRSRPIGLMLAAAVAWVILVLGKGLANYPVGARYLIPAGALLAVCAGWGIAQALRLSLPRRGPIAAAVASIVIVLVAAGQLDRTVESIKASNRQVAAGRSLEQAIVTAGGRDRVAGTAGPTVMANTPLLTRLAWLLEVPLSRVATIWRDDPNERLTTPAVVFEAAVTTAGPVASVPKRFTTRAIGRTGHWSIFELLPASATAGASSP